MRTVTRRQAPARAVLHNFASPWLSLFRVRAGLHRTHGSHSQLRESQEAIAFEFDRREPVRDECRRPCSDSWSWAHAVRARTGSGRPGKDGEEAHRTIPFPRAISL